MMPYEPKIVPLDQGLNNAVLLYGMNGSGKTTTAASAFGRKVVLNWMGNPEVINKTPYAGEVMCIEGPGRWPDIQELCNWPGLMEYDTIILDNVSGLYRIALVDDVVKTAGIKHAFDGFPGMQDYGLASERLRWVAAKLAGPQGLRKTHHIVAIAHTQLVKDEDTGRVEGGPALPGQVPAYFIQLFSEFLYLAETNGKYMLYPRTNIYYPAATRKLDPTKPIENPNLTKLLNMKAPVR